MSYVPLLHVRDQQQHWNKTSCLNEPREMYSVTYIVFPVLFCFLFYYYYCKRILQIYHAEMGYLVFVSATGISLPVAR